MIPKVDDGSRDLAEISFLKAIDLYTPITSRGGDVIDV
jgi:hypothetical protein